MTQPGGAFPIVVGVTGHRDIADGALAAVTASARAVLMALRARYGAAVHVMSALADGADRLVAELARELGLTLIAVAPMPVAEYRATLADDAAREGFDASWAAAGLRLALPRAPGADDPSQFERLGALLAGRCHVLLALWDGQAAGPAPRGGTGHVVQLRAAAGDPARRAGHDLLEAARAWPVIRIATPRRGGAPDGAGTVSLWPGDAAVAAADVALALDEATRRDLDRIADLNAACAAPDATDRFVLARQLGFLPDPGGDAALARLCGWQAAADAAAQHFQRRLLGVWVPAGSPLGSLGNAWRHLRATRRPPPAGALFGFLLVVPLAVLLFETYAHLTHHWLALAGYVALIGASLGFWQFRVKRGQWQNRFQDYRALAEALRVQLFWALAGLSQAVPDHYLRRQEGELGWVRAALQGPALWAAAAAQGTAGRGARRAAVEAGWLRDQRDFFVGADGRSGRARLNDRAARRGHRNAWRCLMAGMAASLCVLGVDAAGTLGFAPAALLHAKEALLVAAALAPALAAFFSLSVESRAYEPHAHAYALMGRLFDRALSLAPGLDDAAFQALVLELGREALTESADWLLEHRRRPIEYKAG